MNNSKKSLILAAGIIEMIGAVLMLFSAVLFLTLNVEVFEEIFLKGYIESGIEVNAAAFKLALIILSAVEFVAYTISSILLLSSVRSNGTFFKDSKKLFIAGFVITIILSGAISLPSILLYCTFIYKDEINTGKKIIEMPKQVVSETEGGKSGITRTIIGYKSLKDRGVITDAEYKGMVIRYLRELKESGTITQEQFDQLLTKLI